MFAFGFGAVFVITQLVFVLAWLVGGGLWLARQFRGGQSAERKALFR